MSKIICSAAIRGAQKIYEKSEGLYKKALEKHGPEQEIGFPNTAYYLPIIYAMTGIPVAKLSEMQKVFDFCKKLIPAPVRETTPLPYLAPALDAGMATFFVEEMAEAIRYLENPDCYVVGEDPTPGNIWLGGRLRPHFQEEGRRVRRRHRPRLRRHRRRRARCTDGGKDRSRAAGEEPLCLHVR